MTTKPQVIAALRKWIAQRPGLEFANYGGMRAYRSEMRSITKDRNDAARMLSAIEWRDSITAEMIIEAAKHSYSGRLSIEETDKGIRIDYCVGQYWPTEYRRAVCAVLAAVLWDYWRAHCMAAPDSWEVYATDKITWRSSRLAILDTRADAETHLANLRDGLADGLTLPGITEMYRGKNAGDFLRDIASRELGRSIANRWFN